MKTMMKAEIASETIKSRIQTPSPGRGRAGGTIGVCSVGPCSEVAEVVGVTTDKLGSALSGSGMRHHCIQNRSLSLWVVPLCALPICQHPKLSGRHRAGLQ